jgi:hypothetical protein
MQQQHCWVEGVVVAGLLASHSPIRLMPQHWGVNIGHHSWDLSGARTAESLHEDCTRDGRVQHERGKDCERAGRHHGERFQQMASERGVLSMPSEIPGIARLLF